MHIGLIGGIGPAATNYYHRRLISKSAAGGQQLDLTIAHAHSPTLLGNLERNDIDAQVAIFSHLTDRLAAAGADCVAVTALAGHFCIEQFKLVSPLPVIDMLVEVDNAVTKLGLKRVGVLGTRTVMETRFYGAISGAEVLPPQGKTLGEVHETYIAMAASGNVTEQQCTTFDDACREFIERDCVDSILLGGTDLALVYDPDTAAFPVLDCAAVHADAIVAMASR